MSRYVATEKAFNDGHPFDSMLSGRNGWIGVGEENAPLREGNLYVYHARDRVTSRVSRYVYRVRGRGVGVMLVVQLNGKAPIITTVFVRASHRRRGIATKLHVGHEGGHAPDFDPCFGKVSNARTCTFLTGTERCELHGKCKPYEGRVAHHDARVGGRDVLWRLKEAWESPLGRRVLRLWRRRFLPEES